MSGVASSEGVKFQVVAKIVAVKTDDKGKVTHTAPVSPVVVLKTTEDLFEAMFSLNYFGDVDEEKLPYDTMVPVAKSTVEKLGKDIKWKKERS